MKLFHCDVLFPFHEIIMLILSSKVGEIGERVQLLCQSGVKKSHMCGGPSEKKCQSSLIFYCKISILCQSLAIFNVQLYAHILLVISDRTDKFREFSVQCQENKKFYFKLAKFKNNYQ